MKPSGELCDPGVPEVNIERKSKNEKEHRRSIRGRRSLIKVAVEGSSPAVIVAPLSDSIVKNTAVDKVTQLTQKRDKIVWYIRHLQSEKEEWLERFERQKLFLDRAERAAGCALECKRAIRKPTDTSGRDDSMQKPRYILNRVLRSFKKYIEKLPDRKTVDELHMETAALERNIASLRTRSTQLRKLLSAEPREELHVHKKWWEDLKNKEARRIQRVTEKLAYLECRESLIRKKADFVIA
ncbi:hypothetical protein DICVIV_00538 [Dictyocaulus viviparus]|uniref:Uncharacterized protein n=1 Tax=Dictyocaulus viviparus TaxID=29172 RepID=A0A0D8YAN1_DICVI|nr:hypothetical protein DICVIV_00538 [Dictyocaulus viviparus]